MKRNVLPLLGAIILTLIIGGCGESDTSPDAARGESAPSSDEPRLLTWSDADVDTFDANVGGTLRVNSAGCFTISGSILVAPAGSRVVDSGEAIRIPGIGTRAVGKTVEGTGGYHTADDPKLTASQLRCAPEGSDAEFGFLTVRRSG